MTSGLATAVKPTIYLVDDDEQILFALKAVLLRRFTVKTNSDPLSALEEIRRLRPAVVILDVKMPERDGFWVFREIRKFNCNVRIIFNSAYQDIERMEDVKDLYMPYAYLTKGGNARDFLNIVIRAAEPDPLIR
jgi:DNA-binding NtrC family response regulator